MFSNTAVPKYYGRFREAVLNGELPICREIGMEMNRIDKLIANPGVYYDSDAIDGWIKFCERELTLTDGSPFHMLDSFKLWGEQVFGWYYFVNRKIWSPKLNKYVTKRICKRLINKQYIILGRGGSKSMYDSTIQNYFLNIDTETTHQITTAPTMRQAEEVLSPIRTAITRAPGPLFQFLTEGSINNTTGSKINRQKLCSTKKGIENFLTNSLLEIRAMSIDKLQGLRCKIATVDEWLSGDIKEDVVLALVQGASKLDDYLVVCTSSEGNVRNGAGDSIKLNLLRILKGEYEAIDTSIWYYRLDDIEEVSDPRMWIKANPNLGITVTYETYQKEVEQAENDPATRNETLAKRFGIPLEGLTYFFTYQETRVHKKFTVDKMMCAMGADLSQGDDFCAFTFLFPLHNGSFGIKTRSYVSSFKVDKLQEAMRLKYDEFVDEDTLCIMDCVVLDMDEVYEDLLAFIDDHDYDVSAFGYDPYNAKEFVDRWITEHGDYGVTVVRQGVKTESVPLGELKSLAESDDLIFDEQLMSFAMGNAITIEDTNGNRKLLKRRHEEKIDNVSALVDSWVAYKLVKDIFE